MQTLSPPSVYERRGVSAQKTDVHNAIKKLDKGLYPGAFCKIIPDVLAGDPNYCIIQHADGAGTKAGLAYLHWKKTDNLDVWPGTIRDSLFMNVDDSLCAGAEGPFLITLTIDRNKARVPGEVIRALIEGCEDVCNALTHDHGIECIFTGGETADVGDLVRTLTVNNTLTVRFRRDKVINASNIRENAYIVGFSSTGKAAWETLPNSGMGANGLTNARHDTLDRSYLKDTETFAPETPLDDVYCGDYKLPDRMPEDVSFSIVAALLSPTRTYSPLAKRLFEEISREHFQGLIHCSGGGQTKIKKFGRNGIVYEKSNLFPTPPLFQMLKRVRNVPWREMFESYNMGHRLEAVVPDKKVAEDCIAISKSLGIDAQIIGETRLNDDPNKRKVVISSNGAREEYEE